MSRAWERCWCWCYERGRCAVVEAGGARRLSPRAAGRGGREGRTAAVPMSTDRPPFASRKQIWKVEGEAAAAVTDLTMRTETSHSSAARRSSKVCTPPPRPPPHTHGNGGGDARRGGRPSG